MRRGLVIGKFLPYHKGHKYLIDTATADCDELYVIICDQASTHDIIPIHKRLGWVRTYHPAVNVMVFDQDRSGLPDWDSKGWAEKTVEFLGFVPEVVYSSEDYGEPWAAYMGSQHVLVDQARQIVPVSGTLVRENSLDHLDMLMPKVRAHFVERVLIIGTESTGKTTLARDLAAALNTNWVPEYGRIYTEIMPSPTEHIWTTHDFEHIIEIQNQLEDEYAGFSNRVLICDTNSFVTHVFHTAYMGWENWDFEYLWNKRHYDLYIKTPIETPFVQDESQTRNPGPQREMMDELYDEFLQGKPTLYVSGTPEQRLEQSLAALEFTGLTVR